MNDTAPDERPWTAKGLTPEERAFKASNGILAMRPNDLASLRDVIIQEAIEASVRDALADAGPKWVTPEIKPDEDRKILLCVKPPKSKPYIAIGYHCNEKWWMGYSVIDYQYMLGWQYLPEWIELPPAPEE